MGTKLKRLIFCLLMTEVFAIVLFGQATLPPANLSDTVPPPPSGYTNCHFQYDNSVPRNISVYCAPSGGQAYNSGYGICNGLTPGYSPLGTAITPGMSNFGPSNFWHTDVTSAAVDPNSEAIKAFVSLTTRTGYSHQER